MSPVTAMPATVRPNAGAKVFCPPATPAQPRYAGGEAKCIVKNPLLLSRLNF
jgi:hypothetical protein